MKTIVLRALTMAAALLPVAGTARAEWLSSHAVACYETTDLEFIVRYYRPELSICERVVVSRRRKARKSRYCNMPTPKTCR